MIAIPSARRRITTAYSLPVLAFLLAPSAALATQPPVQAYIAERDSLSVPEGSCTTQVSGGRDVGYGIRFLVTTRAPHP
jgi:hypothetical protein